jgi:hypothetical protein
MGCKRPETRKYDTMNIEGIPLFPILPVPPTGPPRSGQSIEGKQKSNLLQVSLCTSAGSELQNEF